MKHRYTPTAPSSRRYLSVRGGLVFLALSSISLSPAVTRADLWIPGARPYTTIASGTLHTCAILYNGQVACWGSNALEQLGAAADNPILAGITTEDQPPATPAVQGSCLEAEGAENADCPSDVCNPDGGTCDCTPSTCGGTNSCLAGGVCQSSVCTSDTDCTMAGSTCTACSSSGCSGTGACTCTNDCPGDSSMCNPSGACVPPPPPSSSSCSMGVDACAPGYVCSSADTCVPETGSVPTVPVPAFNGTGWSWPPLSNVVAVAPGDGHTCALLVGPTNGGTVWCWGEGSAGQLGNGSYNAISIPQQVSGIGAGSVAPAIAVASGANHACAVLADGTLQCWGDNNQAQLGNSSAGARSNVPVLVSGGIGNAMAITAGAEHACALLTGGGLVCWGGNVYGQVGVGTGASSYSTPQYVGVGGVTLAVAAGRLHTCAIIVVDGGSTTQVACWGDNLKGQLGSGTTAPSPWPSTVPGLSQVRSISAGGDHTCAVLASGAVKCWGDNGDGETGNDTSGMAGTNSPSPSNLITTSPTAVSGLSCTGTADCARAISSGYFHNCAVLGNGTTQCWGGGEHSQLGNNALTEQDTPVNANLPALVSAGAQATAGYYDACVLLASGGAECWGNGGSEQLGDDTTTNQSSPTYVEGLPYPGYTSTTPAISICTGYDYSCALLVNGTVECWGDNTYGQLGNGTTTASGTAVKVLLGDSGTAVQISCGLYHACAVMGDDNIQCWGYNGVGQLGNDSFTSAATPVTTWYVGAIDSAVMQVVAGGLHTCAVTGGGVMCWGYNGGGQLGVGYTSDESITPVHTSISTVRSLGLGWYHTCAVNGNGTASCWGDGSYGQVGDGSTTAANDLPVAVENLTGLVAIGGGGWQSCALSAAGAVQCWGDDASGELGNGSTTQVDAPPDGGAPALTAVGAIGTGTNTECVARTDGTVYCWGNNSYSTLGNPAYTSGSYDTPVPVAGLPTDGGT